MAGQMDMNTLVTLHQAGMISDEDFTTQSAVAQGQALVEHDDDVVVDNNAEEQLPQDGKAEAKGKGEHHMTKPRVYISIESTKLTLELVILPKRTSAKIQYSTFFKYGLFI